LTAEEASMCSARVGPGGVVPRALLPRLRALGGAVILGLLLWRVGGGVFLDGLRVIDARALALAFAIGVLTTVSSAWRWCLVARGLGMTLRLRDAIGDYYRSLFVNAVLPGGVLGDVHRAVRHGRDSGDLGRGVKAVAIERFAGQLLLITVGVAVLVESGSTVLPGGWSGAVIPVALAGAVAAAASGGVVLVRRGRSRWAHGVRALGADARRGLFTRDTWPGILATSVVVLGGHLATFVVAARAAGSTVPFTQLAPLMLLALVAMTLPINVGGWGPREGVTAWAFGASGLGAGHGATIAVVYGLFALVASLPGAVVLLVPRVARRQGRSAAEPVGEGVPQQGDVPDLPDLGQHRPVTLIPREVAVADEARRARVTDEERGNHQVELVRQTGGEELGVDRRTALHHQPGHAPAVQVGRHPAQVHRLAAVDDGRHRGEPVADVPEGGRRAVHQLLAITGGEEPGVRIQLPAAGHRHLRR
jgi:uncharacterized membrane protein YbhN (UPF0104 family)